MSYDRTRPLGEVVVIDETQALSGPFATQILADRRTEVVEIERPERGDLTACSRRTTGVVGVLREHEIPCSPANSVMNVVDGRHIEPQGMLETVEHSDGGEFTLIDHPVNVSTLEADIRTAPPTLGEHTEGVLGRLGYDAEDVEPSAKGASYSYPPLPMTGRTARRVRNERGNTH